MDKTDIRIPTDEELTAYMEKSAVSANGAYEQSPVVMVLSVYHYQYRFTS